MLDQVSSEQCSLATIKQVNEAQNNLLAIVSNKYGPEIYDMKRAMEKFSEGFETYTTGLDTILGPKNETLFDFEYKEKIVSFGDRMQELLDNMKTRGQSYTRNCETCQRWIDKFNGYSLKEYEENELGGKDGTHEFSFEKESIRQYESRKRETETLENDIISMLDEIIQSIRVKEKLLCIREDLIIEVYNICENSMNEIIDKLDYSINMTSLTLLAGQSITNGMDVNQQIEQNKLDFKNALDWTVIVVSFIPGWGTAVGFVYGAAWGAYYALNGEYEKSALEFIGIIPAGDAAQFSKNALNKGDELTQKLGKKIGKKTDDVVSEAIKEGIKTYKGNIDNFNKVLDYIIDNQEWADAGKAVMLGLVNGVIDEKEAVGIAKSVKDIGGKPLDIKYIQNEYNINKTFYDSLFDILKKMNI